VSFKKLPNGEFYFFGKGGVTELEVKAGAYNYGRILYAKSMDCPAELVGKKVRMKLEIVENPKPRTKLYELHEAKKK